jgi:hypothetical protein
MASAIPRKPLVGNNYFGLDKLIPPDNDMSPVLPNDPVPTEIKTKPMGPFPWTLNSIICNYCGHIIRENYLPAHRANGACDRNIQKQDLTTNPRMSKHSG